MQITTVGLDLAKNVFQVHAVDAKGKVVVRRRLRRAKVRDFFAGLEPCLIGLEACGTAHYWARELRALGHEARIMPPSYVKAYVRRGKNDAVDAAAICEAVTRPTMRFVPVKTEDQQSALMLHKARELLIRQRTMLINALGAHMAELGMIAPQGKEMVDDLIAVIEDGEDESVPALAKAALTPLVTQLRAASKRSPPPTTRSWPGTRATRPAGAWRRSPGSGSASRRQSRRPCPIRRSSAPGANSPPGWGWFPGRTPAAARSGSAAYRSRETATSGNFWCSAPPVRCARPARAGRRERTGSTVCSSAGRHGWSPSPWPTRGAHCLGLAGQGRNLPRSLRGSLTKGR